MMAFIKQVIALTMVLFVLVGCASGGGVVGNEGGSQPINDQEGREYQKAINRCYKTGGTRIVKIEGKLRCF